ncbi:hypothetical protein Tco_0344009 [Tanacetum coccineum]
MESVKKSIDERALHKREYGRSGNDADTEDANIRLVNDQEPLAEVDSNTTPDSTNMSHRRGDIDQNAEKYQIIFFKNHYVIKGK